jgi:hypothetical protein
LTHAARPKKKPPRRLLIGTATKQTRLREHVDEHERRKREMEAERKRYP